MAEEKPEDQKKKAKKPRFPIYLATGLTLFFSVLYFPGVIGLFEFPGAFDGFEGYWQDTLYRVHYDNIPTGDPRIVIAAIDDDSLRELGWPFTRDVHALLLDKLSRLGAKTIAFDVMFFDPDKRHPEGDKQLIDATAASKRTIHLVAIRVDRQTVQGKTIQLAKFQYPIPGLMEASQYVGYPNVDKVIDTDGHIRRMEIFNKDVRYTKDDRLPFPSLDAVAAASFTDKPLEYFTERFEQPWLFYLRFKKPIQWIRHPYAMQQRKTKILNEEEVSSAYRYISVKDILSDRLVQQQRSALKGGLVIIGSTALGLFDHYPSPFSKNLPGVEFHANAIDNILHEDFMQGAAKGNILLILICFIWLPVLVARLSPLASAAILISILGGWLGFTNWKFMHGFRYDFIAPAMSLITSYLILTVYRVLTEGAEKRFIKQTFGQFVAPEVVDNLVKDPGKVKLGGEKRDMTVFFLDIAHFTTISEKMTPEALILFLNKYLSALSLVIHDQKGVVDKYIGDCIMAFWNAPLEQKDHRALACLSAVECQRIMGDLNKNLDPNMPEKPAIRIGLNSGEMTVGLTGSEKKLQYTVIGDEVNLASRLEGANKFFGSKIMASESCYEGAKDTVEARELGRVRVVGKAIPIRVYELLARKGGMSESWKQALPLYQSALVLFNKRDFSGAKAAFAEVLKLIPDDPPSKLYLNAAEDYSQIPPPPDWDGVFNLTAK